MSHSYAELFCQSNFSFLTGASHAEELVLQADFLRYHAIAITDECSVAGVVRAHSAIKNHNLSIKLLIGSLFWLNSECQLVLLAPNRHAYAELCRVITNARRRSDKGHYQLFDWDILSLKHCFILWLPCHQTSDEEWAKWLARYHSGRLWLGLQRHLKQDDRAYVRHCEALAQQFHLPITACGGVVMHHADRLPLQHTLTAIKHHSLVDTLGDHRLVNAEQSLRGKEKLQRLFRPEWIAESVAIAQRCDFDLASLRYEYPHELVPPAHTPMSYLRQLVAQGAQRRFHTGVPDEIAGIIEKELALIEELEYAYFFLTIHDVVMFAKDRGILYQGRGSAANSIVCYCLEITSVDPRQISVLFERFISKERNEPPDIDVDFEHERREEVIQYLYQKYGRERAALAATVISYRFKSAVRDVGKALGIEETQLDFFIKHIHRRDTSTSWQDQITELGLRSDTLKGQQFITLVEAIIGFPRHLSQHVGGFVISAGPLYELVPVENAAMEDRTIIQWDKDDLESLGLLKVDVLALGMLSAIRKCFQLIETHYQQALTIADITRKQDDTNVYRMIQQADTVGVFQIESRAQMSMLPRLKPANYYDLVIQIAIVRPGPIQGDMVHPFLKRRQGIETIDYPSDEVRDVLERTLGVPIFQEQVIKLAMVAAGFTGGEADQLRRAMAAWKKHGNVMRFKDKLISGMLSRGYESAFAERLFEQICGFGEYGFPESHSASFAVLAYCSAWLKYHYPAAFYTALLNSQPMGFYSSSQLLQDAQRHGVAVLPICINQSSSDHQLTLRPDGSFAIQLGFRMIKGLSSATIRTVIDARPTTGYQHLTQVKNLPNVGRDIEKLASANAFATLHGDRFQARWQAMDNLSELPLFRGLEDSAQHTLQAPSQWQNTLEDFASTGISLAAHPITQLEQAGKLPRFTRRAELAQCRDRALVTVIGLVTGRQSPSTAAGVTFLTLEDDTGNISVVVWQATARAQKEAYLTAKLLMVKGVVEKEGDVLHIVAGRLEDLTDSLTGLNTRSRDFH
ncbi:error-prone DNA polymerase [Vibrio sp. SM6]|uniref:Error-prone DNA polymerase n=1 Tax=Vibrio agarilyticus TaxID=2726741 RepID=A0A7X8TMW0_9VIBR|nr:error-prone DNA polymerase [Vibrio agarilyticus]NLS11490.1 error-prone DNA polymerase [Vibrio agarilyticus]